jgi:hypothetical protein
VRRRGPRGRNAGRRRPMFSHGRFAVICRSDFQEELS